MDLSLPARIAGIYDSCNEKEKYYLRCILQELVDEGYSKTYEQIWLSDYKEIPVDIDTFIESDLYLGKTNRNGAAVYPFWRTELRNIFHAGNKYEECFFTGATRIGKSSTAITGTAYMLYKLMCLRNPQQYYGKKDVSKFSVLFFNITKDQAKDVGFREFNDTLKATDWFNQHGKFSRSENDFFYIPEGDKIVVDYGSSGQNALGKQVFVGFCLVGSTNVVTSDGVHTLEELYSSDNSNVLVASSGGYRKFDDVKLTKYVTDTVRITLDDGTVIEGTPEHRIMLSDGSYKMLRDLTDDDYFTDSGVRLRKSEVIYYDDPIPVYDIVGVEETHNFVIAGNTCNVISHNCDEMNFSKAGVKDVMKAKQHMAELYNTVATRVKGTFRVEGEVHGKIFAVSSKRSDSDFMELYMKQQLEAGAGDHMYISDAPQWEVLPKSMFHEETFTIAVGDRYKKGFVVPENQDNEESLHELEAQGYTLMHPPIDMRSDFIADFDIALRDIAGITVPGSLSFITQDILDNCIGTRKNPFINDILQIGTKDTLSIEEFFHLEYTDKRDYSCPVYIHLDLSLNTDKTGISAVAVTGAKDMQDLDGNTISQISFTHLFSVSLEAPRGDKIPYNKILVFIKWLRKQGFNIQSISRDQFQSEYLGELLEAQGFDSPKISLDRTPDGYMALRTVLIEKRIDMLDCQFLQDELIHLQRDAASGKIDHTIGRSKDVSDSFAGSVWNAIMKNPDVPVKAKSVAGAIASVNQPRPSRNSVTLGGMMFPGIKKY